MIEKSAQMGGVWGWRGVLGYICPSVLISLQSDNFSKSAPEGVGLMVATLGINRVNEENLLEALTHVENAARQLAEGGANYIHLNGPFGVIVGFEGEEKLKKRLEELTELPVGIEYESITKALNALSVKKLTHVNPRFPTDDYKSRLSKAYGDRGFEMVNYKGLGLKTNAEARKVPMSTVYNLAREAYLENPQADAIYVSCGTWGGPPVVDRLEQDIGKPVLVPDSVFLWAGLKALKIKSPVKGYGRLFETI